MNPNHPMTFTGADSRRGSVLVTVVLVVLLVGTLATLFLSQSYNEYRLADATFYQNSLINLAESGAEEAMWTMRYDSDPTTGWRGWETVAGATGTRTRTFDQVMQERGVQGTAKVTVSNINTGGPVVAITANVSKAGQSPLTKYVQIKLGRRALFANAVTSEKTFTIKGNNVLIASFSSSQVPSMWPLEILDNKRNLIPSERNKFNDKAVIASLLAEVDLDGLVLAGATILGYAATAGADIEDAKADLQTEDGYATGKRGVDATLKTKDFASSLDAPPVPFGTPGVTNTNVEPIVLIGSNDPKNPVLYDLGTMDVSKSIEVRGGYVQLKVKSLKLTGNQSLYINKASDPSTSLTLHASGDVKIAGNGSANSPSGGVVNGDTTNYGKPIDLCIYGTAPSSTSGPTQTIDLCGNGKLAAVVYAPNASIALKGGGNSGVIYGAAVGETITMNGNGRFYYDEDLQKIESQAGYRMVSWKETNNITEFSSW